MEQSQRSRRFFMATQNEVNFNKLFQMYSIMAQVTRAVDVTARMRRVTLGGEGLIPLIDECLPADAIKLYLPEPGQVAILPKFITLPGWRKHYNVRAYTIRQFNPETLELDIDILFMKIVRVRYGRERCSQVIKLDLLAPVTIIAALPMLSGSYSQAMKVHCLPLPLF
jgi:hypothetical protein